MRPLSVFHFLIIMFRITWWPSAGKELSFWLSASAVLLEPRHDKTNKVTVRPAKTQSLRCPHEESLDP